LSDRTQIRCELARDEAHWLAVDTANIQTMIHTCPVGLYLNESLAAEPTADRITNIVHLITVSVGHCMRTWMVEDRETLKIACIVKLLSQHKVALIHCVV